MIDRLNALFVAAAQAPEVKSKLQQLGPIMVTSSPAEFKRFKDEQYQRMGDAIRRSGIKAE